MGSSSSGCSVTTAEVMWQWLRDGRTESCGPSPACRNVAPTAFAQRPPVGRGDELEEFASAVFAAGPAGAPVVLLRGEPGIGKTTIWEYVVADAVARGRRVLKACEALEP